MKVDGRKRSGRSLLASLGLLSCLLFPALAAAQAVVEKIEVEGNEFLSTEAFLALTDVEVGDTFDAGALQSEFWKLWDTGLFDDVSIYEADGESGGKVVIFRVREKPRVDSVTFEKTKAIGDTRIEDVLSANDALLTVNSTLDQERVGRAKRILEELFASEGHPEARVTVDQRRVSRSRVALHFQVDPGPKVKIEKIEFSGNEVFSDRQLKGMLRETKEKGLFSFMSSKSVFYQPRFEDDLRGIRQAYRAKGYIDTQIGEPVLRDARPGKSGKEERQLVTLVVPIEEGQQYRLDGLTISGNTVFPEASLRELIPLASGEVLNDRLLRLGLSRVDSKYGDAGYLFAATSPRYTPDPDRLVADVDVQITEGDQYAVGRISFDGNVRTRDEVLRREMRIQEGDTYSQRDYLVSLRKIAQLGFWQLEGEPELRPSDEKDKEVDILIRGKETGRNEIQVGGGFSGVDGFFATFSFSSLNFLGRGSQFSVSGQLGGETTRYSLSYIEPYFAATRSTLGGSLFVRDQDFSGFDREGRGGSVFWSYPTSTFSAFRLTGSWENSKIISSSTSVDEDEFTTYSVTPSITFDTRDNPLRPTRGRRISTALELGTAEDKTPTAGDEFAQGNVNFVKPRLGYTHYWRTTKKQYLALHFEGGHLGSLDSGGPDPVINDMIEPPFLPIFERFFLGGERSIRGVETRSVGPHAQVRDMDTGALIDNPVAIGGDQYYLLNLEYTFPLSNIFELTGFLDIGNSYGVSNVDVFDVIEPNPSNNPNLNPVIEIIDSDPLDVRGTAGLELRFHTPVLQQPLRLIYGCKVFGDFFDDEGSCDFQFSIGRTFQ